MPLQISIKWKHGEHGEHRENSEFKILCALCGLCVSRWKNLARKARNPEIIIQRS
jgi:hypothetical protein